MKKIPLIMIVLVFSTGLLLSQTIADYAFTSATNGSLIDMSSGTTDIFSVGAYRDDVASSLYNIGFTYNFGTEAYTQFSVNSNGQMQLGSTIINHLSATPSAGLARIAPISGDNALTAVGKVHYKVLGSEPNRILVVEWDQMRIYWGSTSSPPYSTFQALLYENSKRVDFIYGQMYNTRTEANNNGIYISTSNVAGSVGCLQTITTTPTWNTTLTSPALTSFPASSYMTNLHSAADGSRTVFTFMYTPPTTGVLSVSPNPVAFAGNTYTVHRKTQTVTLSNRGVADFTINAGGISLGGASYFTLDNLPTLPYLLIPTAEVTFIVVYEPEAAGAHTDVLTINSTLGEETFNVSGTGVVAQVGEICENPYLIPSFPHGYSGTTSGFANDYTTSMVTGYTGSYMNGLDWVAQLNIPYLGQLSCSVANAEGVTASQYMGAFLFDSVPSAANPATVIASATASSGTISFNAILSPGTYYLIIDNWPTPNQIYFDLSLDFVVPTEAPRVAGLVSPTPTGVGNIATTATLNWSAPSTGGAVQGYYLYFGTDGGGTVTPTNLVNGTALAANVTSYNPDPDMALETTFYWQVVPYNPISPAADCPIWSFTTASYPLTGEKTIGTGGDYETFTAAVNELNAAGVGENGVTFNVLAQDFVEDIPIITASGTSANPIIFQKAPATRTNPVIKPTDVHGIRITGGDHITFDGIDITRNGAGADYGYHILGASATNGAQYNTIKNCTITLDKTDTSTKGIYLHYGSTPSSAENASSYNKIQNVTVNNSTQGIIAYSLTHPMIGTEISGCTLGADTAGDMGGATTGYGIDAYQQRNIKIFNNTIRNFTTTSTVYGIYLSSGSTDGVDFSNDIYGNTVHTLNNNSTNSSCYGIYASSITGNLNVHSNKVYSIGSTGNSTGFVHGVYVYLSSSGTNIAKVFNNMVWDIYSGYTGTGSTSYLATGIYLGGATAGNTYNVDFNSVRIAGPLFSHSAGIRFAFATALNVLRNNVIENYTGDQTGTYYHNCVYFLDASIGAAGSTSNNNVLYIPNGGNGNVVRISDTANYGTIAAWNTVSTFDGDSRPTNPQFDLANPLDILTGITTPVESKGSFFEGAINWVSKDIYGTDRDLSTPDIGAHEGNFEEEVLCETPLEQPTDLVLLPYPNAIAGTFTEPANPSDSYLVVRYTDATLSQAPTDLTYYAVNDVLGNGVIAKVGAGNTFTAAGLDLDTVYNFSIFAYNQEGIGGPLYLVDDPLIGTMQTMPFIPDNPVAFTATAVGTDQVNLYAEENAAGQQIMVAWNTVNTFGTPEATGYAEGNSIPGGGTVLYIGPAADLPNHSGLDLYTDYHYKAWSVYSADRATYYAYSSGLSASTKTWIDPITTFPFEEGFDGETFAPYGWLNYKTAGTSSPGIWDRQTAGTYPTCTPQAGAAMARFNTYNLYAGGKAILATPPLASAVDELYRVKFWMYRDSGSYTTYDLVNVYVNFTPSAEGATLLGTINRYSGFTPIVATANQWYQYAFNLPVETASSTRFVIFEGVSDYGSNIFIDEVRIERIFENDFSATQIYGPAFGSTGFSNQYEIRVFNSGWSDQEDYTVNLYSADTRQLLDSIIVQETLSEGETATHSLSWIPVSTGQYQLYAEVELPGDENGTNNQTGQYPVSVGAALELPYLETWDNPAGLYWTLPTTNWYVTAPTGVGNPAPALCFNYSPRVYNYTRIVYSGVIDATEYSQIGFGYDYYLDNWQNSTGTIEGLSIQVSTGNGWMELENITNQTPGYVDIPWITNVWDLSELAAGQMCQFRFIAYGEDSYNIDNWYIDNVSVRMIPQVSAPLEPISGYMNQDLVLDNLDMFFEGDDSMVFSLAPSENFTFSSGVNSLTLSPNPDWYGVDYLMVRASNALGQYSEQELKVTVIQTWGDLETFDHGGVFADGWTQTFVGSGDYHWQPVVETGVDYAMRTTFNTGKSGIERLISRLYNLSTYKEIQVSFTSDYLPYGSGTATFAYSLNGSSYTTVASFSSAHNGTMIYNLPALDGKSQVWFRWQYSNGTANTGQANHWVVDDFLIQGVVKDSQAPAQIENLQVTALTDSSVILGWQPTSDLYFGRYELYVSPDVIVNTSDQLWSVTQDHLLYYSATTQTTISPLAGGEYWVAIRALDQSSNASPLSDPVSFYIDVFPPLFTDPIPTNQPEPEPINVSQALIGCTIGDVSEVDQSTMMYRIDTNGNGVYDEGEIWQALPERTRMRITRDMLEVMVPVEFYSNGTYAFEFKAKDIYGNEGFSGGSAAEGIGDDWVLIIDLDEEGPTFSNPIPAGQPNPEWSVSYTCQIGATIQDALNLDYSSIMYRIDANGNGIYDETEQWQVVPIRSSGNRTREFLEIAVDVTLDGDGVYAFEFKASDINGNQAYSGTSGLEGIADDWVLRIDGSAPVFANPIPANQPEPEWMKTYTVTIGASIQDLNAIDSESIMFRVDTNGNGIYDEDETWQALPPDSRISRLRDSQEIMVEVTLGGDGIYAYEFKAADIMGNMGFSGTSSGEGIADDWILRIDTDAPMISMPIPTDQPLPEWSANRTLSIGATITDANQIDPESVMYRIDSNRNGIYDESESWQAFTLTPRTAQRNQTDFVTEITVPDDGIYSFEIKASDVSGKTSFSGMSSIEGIADDWVIRVDATPPAAMQYFFVMDVSSSGATLSWSASSDLNFAGYRIYYSTEAEVDETDEGWDWEDDPALAQSGAGLVSTYITGLLPAIRYYFILQALDTLGNITQHPDEITGMTTPPAAPKAPENVVLEFVEGQLRLSWDDVIQDVEGDPVAISYYAVYIGDHPDFECDFDSLYDYCEDNEYFFPLGTEMADCLFFKVIAVSGSVGREEILLRK